MGFGGGLDDWGCGGDGVEDEDEISMDSLEMKLMRPRSEILILMMDM